MLLRKKDEIDQRWDVQSLSSSKHIQLLSRENDIKKVDNIPINTHLVSKLPPKNKHPIKTCILFKNIAKRKKPTYFELFYIAEEQKLEKVSISSLELPKKLHKKLKSKYSQDVSVTELSAISKAVAKYYNNFEQELELTEAPDAQFTSLKNSICSEMEMAEIAAALGEWKSSYIAYAPSRIALHETTAIIETEVKIREDADLKPVVMGIYRKYVKPAMASCKQDMLDLMTDVNKKSRALVQHIQETCLLGEEKKIENDEEKWVFSMYKKIQSRIMAGEFNPNKYLYDKADNMQQEDFIRESSIFVISNLLYQKKMREKVICLVESMVERGIDECKEKFPRHDKQGKKIGSAAIERLSTHVGSQRHTFLIVGPPASGKGTATGMIEVMAEEEFGIDWADIVKINTDNHRNIVGHPKELSDNLAFYSSLTNDESAYITDRVYFRMFEKIKANKTPHMLIDGVVPDAERFDLGSLGNGTLHIAVVTVPVEVSICRAFARGEATGRFVASDYLISSHKNVTMEMFTNILKYKHHNIEFEIYDTFVPRGASPKKLAYGNLAGMEVVVLDAKGLAEFYAKIKIDCRARSKKYLFASPNQIESYDYHVLLEKEGFKITYVEETLPLKLKNTERNNTLGIFC